jgi:hypothetical protein
VRGLGIRGWGFGIEGSRMTGEESELWFGVYVDVADLKP